MKIDLHLSKLRSFGLNHRDDCGKYNVIAGILKGNTLIAISQNSSINDHAEPTVLKKPCILRT